MTELWRWEMHLGERFETTGHSQGAFKLLHVEQGQLKIGANEAEFSISAGCSAVANTDLLHEYANEGVSQS